jgi:hypothetical protein
VGDVVRTYGSAFVVLGGFYTLAVSHPDGRPDGRIERPEVAGRRAGRPPGSEHPCAGGRGSCASVTVAIEATALLARASGAVVSGSEAGVEVGWS